MSNLTIPPGLRWSNYFLRRGDEVKAFWREYLQDSNRQILFVIGQGFDPRMCHGIEAVLSAGGSGLRDVVAIQLGPPNFGTTQLTHLFEGNKDRLNKLIKDHGKIELRNVRIWSDDHRRIGSRSASDIFANQSDFSNYTDIVVDISALPRGIYFSLIGKILFILDSIDGHAKPAPNLHVMVSESAELDNRIKHESIDEHAYYVHGFMSDLEAKATGNVPKIWIPILGEERLTQLQRIYSMVVPNETCPVLPSPSVNPRSGDNLLIEYRDFLFDVLDVEPRNIIYAAEQNPFEAYRQICRTVQHYGEALRQLGGCKVSLSALSSKLLSIGALLSAYELKKAKLSIGIANIEAQGYKIEGDTESFDSELFTMMLAGDSYES